MPKPKPPPYFFTANSAAPSSCAIDARGNLILRGDPVKPENRPKRRWQEEDGFDLYLDAEYRGLFEHRIELWVYRRERWISTAELRRGTDPAVEITFRRIIPPDHKAWWEPVSIDPRPA